MRLRDIVAPKLASLSPKLQQAALYVVEHPEEVATRSLRQVARATDMSAPTFSRLAEELSFASYEELREACLSQLRQQEQSFAAKARALQDQAARQDEGGAFIVHQAQSTISNINRLMNSVDPEQIETAANRLACARKVILVGMMSSRPFVDYLAYMASMGFDSWRVLGGEAGADAALLSDIGEDDVALVISKAPYATQAIRAASYLKGAGAHVIGVTDRIDSPLSGHCNTVFLVSTDTPQFFTSHAATLVLLETLIGLAVKASGPQVGQRIARIEASCHEMGEYVSNTNRVS
ncbi:MurR/RpiR family transcriptional regulator [Roseovarius sp. CAU 1744]|uniref:MurR/RpiR family transcriptional regulator n=1 Tax=Roseovarius sp. CAU 1744 TaxID=3140368 RepID=UPI00325A653D